MTRRAENGHLAWTLGVPAVLLYLVGTTLIVGQLRDPEVAPFEFWIEGTFSGPVILAIALILLARRPDHRISQLFALLVAAGSIQTASGAAATTLLHAGPGELGTSLAWIHDLSQMALVIALVLIALLFPTGQLPSSRWRPIAWFTVYGGLTALVATALRPGPLGNFPAVTNPLALDTPLLEVLYTAGIWALLVGFGGAVLAPIVRFGRARGVEREQLKWFAFSVAAAASVLVLAEPLLPDSEFTGALVWTIAPTGVVAVVGLTVLRYRLYDIDRLVSRTVSYAILTALLVGVYLVGVVGLGALVRASAGGAGGDLVVAASTLAVAALFQPLRRRIKTVVDRRFNRTRYDTGLVVERFAQRLRHEVDLTAVRGELVTAAVATVQPASVEVWLVEEIDA